MYKYADTPRNTWGSRMESRTIGKYRPYEGTIKPEQVYNSSEFNQVPGRANPYRYYQLSPDYYDFWRKHDTHSPSVLKTAPVLGQTHSEFMPRISTQTRQGKQQQNTQTKIVAIFPDKSTKSKQTCCWTRRKQIHPEKNRSSEMQTSQRQASRSDKLIINDTRNKTPNDINKRAKESNLATQSYFRERPVSRVVVEKELNFPSTLSSRPKMNKSQRKELSLSVPVSTYPAATDILQQSHFNPLYKETTDSMFSPLVPVALEDYSRSVPVKRVSSKTLVAGNPLIPVMVPAERVGSNDLYSSRDSLVSSAFYVEDYKHDSFSRRYTDIPSYNAVGFVLNDSDDER